MAVSISLEELVALNDEIAGLVRSGVPLEVGLAGWGGGVRGRLGRIVSQLGQSIAQGNSLAQSLALSPANFPPVYRAIVTAGIRSGRLPAALESLATSARNLQDVRRSLALAVLYPLVVLTLGYFALWLVLCGFLPVLLSPYEGNAPPFWTAVARFGQWANWPVRLPFTDSVIVAGAIPPLLLALIVAAWWLSTRRAVLLGGGSAGRLIEWIPFAGRSVRDARLASLAEILGLLVEHDVPLGEAVVLAAECTADRRLLRTARALADSLHEGALSATPRQLAGFPPLLAWLISSGGRQQTFVSMARHVADTYRRRVAGETRWLQDTLPMWLVVVIGGGLVLVLGVLTFLPFTELMKHLSETVGESMRIKP